jgi:hypothetical protein
MKTMVVFSREDFEGLSALLQNAVHDAEVLEKNNSSYLTSRLIDTLHNVQQYLKEDNDNGDD